MLDTVRRTTAPTRLAGTLYVYSFFDEFILLYPFYAVLFADTGLTTAEISSLFVIWSITSVVLEIPSGVLADLISRRLLLVIGPLLSAAGFALWVFAPSYPAFAAGFVLWGVKGALESGAVEALVYEELDRHGAASRYATVRGRSRTAALVATALAMLAAVPVFGAGGYQAVGVASVAACVLAAAVAATFAAAFAVRERRMPRALDRLGAISYSLYVLHVIVLSAFGRLVPHLADRQLGIRLVVGVAVNAGKGPMFSIDERIAQVRAEIEALGGAYAGRIEVRSFDNLLVDFAAEADATVIIRGLRAVSDFDYEFQMSSMNAKLDSNIDTVCLMASDKYQFIASRLVKEIAQLGGDVSPFVSPRVRDALGAKVAARG